MRTDSFKLQELDDVLVFLIDQNYVWPDVAVTKAIPVVVKGMVSVFLVKRNVTGKRSNDTCQF